jgi:CheY-like chemotaxis protein
MTSRRNAATELAALVVLIVDDEPLVRESLARNLRAEGLTAIAVPSALHALQILDDRAVDLVVTDLRMPGPSGLRLLESVRDGWPDVGRILLTAYVTDEARQSRAVDMMLDKGEDAAFVIDSIVNAARQRK